MSAMGHPFDLELNNADIPDDMPPSSSGTSAVSDTSLEHTPLHSKKRKATDSVCLISAQSEVFNEDIEMEIPRPSTNQVIPQLSSPGKLPAYAWNFFYYISRLLTIIFYHCSEHIDSPKNPYHLPPGFETDCDKSFRLNFDNPILRFFETLRATGNILRAAKTLLNLDEGDPGLHVVRKSLRDGLELLDRQYESQDEFEVVVEVWKGEFYDAIMKMSRGKYEDRLNFGDGLSPLTVCLMIAHFAPWSCRSYKDTRRYSSRYCKIDRNNPCMRMFDWILAKSLHKEAGGEWNDATREAVSERLSIVDAKILITEDTDDHANEFKTFCNDNQITMDEMNLVGFLLFAFHVKHREIGPSYDSPLNVMVTSADANKEFFAKCGYFLTELIRFLGYAPHGQVWATKTLKNYSLYPIERLREFSARLACFYQAIAIDIAQTPSCPATLLVPFVSEIAQRFAALIGLTPEELEDLRMNAGARSEAADLVRHWKSQGLVMSSEDARALLLLFFPPIYATMWYGCVEGGETTGAMRTETKELLDKHRCDKTDTEACFAFIKANLSLEHAKLWIGGKTGSETAGAMRTEAKELLDDHGCDKTDTEACFAFIKENLSLEHAKMWIGSVEGGKTGGETAGAMKTAAKELVNELSRRKLINRNDTEGCYELIKEHISEEAAKAWKGTVEGGKSHQKTNEARVLVDQGIDVDIETRLLALKSLLKGFRLCVTRGEKRLRELPGHLQEDISVVGHLYRCRHCKEESAVVRYNRTGAFVNNQRHRCHRFGCSEEQVLPWSADSDNIYYVHVRTLTTEECRELWSQKEERILTMIDELECAESETSPASVDDSVESDGDETFLPDEGTGKWALRFCNGKLSAYFRPSVYPVVGSAVSVAFEEGIFGGKVFEAGFYDGEIVAVSEGVVPGTFKIGVTFEDGSYEECNYPSADVIVKYTEV